MAHASRLNDAKPSLVDLKAERWDSGKAAVAAVKRVALLQGKQATVDKKGGTFRCLVCTSAPECGWYVMLARYRGKAGPGDWHVTSADLDHRNCTTAARPTQHQVAEHPVVRAAVAANLAASAQSLVTQLRHQAGIGCSNSMMYRAKQQINAGLFSEDPMTITLLPSFLSKFQQLNPGTYAELQRDETGRFKRAIVIMRPSSFATCQNLYGVDAAHMKHRKYNGVQIIMVGRDGNLRNRIVAVALAPVEDHDNYLWFFDRIMTHGFALATVPVFTDRHKGIISATTQLGIFNMFCVRHIIGNMRADKSVHLPVSQEKFVWAANGSQTETAFNINIGKLGDVNPAAAAYLKEIPAAKWALYSHYQTTRLYGWRTTNFVESEQARSLKLKPRLMLPYEYFKSYANILMREAYTSAQLADAWFAQHRVLTPRAEGKLQRELLDAANYTVNFSTNDIAFVARVTAPLTQRRVDLCSDESRCSCLQWLQHGISCRHIIAVLQARRDAETGSAIGMMAECYKVNAFKQQTPTLEIPEEDALESDSTLSPAQFNRQAGRPRKRRLRSQGEVGRMRKLYVCGKCGKADGHNRASCKGN